MSALYATGQSCLYLIVSCSQLTLSCFLSHAHCSNSVYIWVPSANQNLSVLCYVSIFNPAVPNYFTLMLFGKIFIHLFIISYKKEKKLEHIRLSIFRRVTSLGEGRSLDSKCKLFFENLWHNSVISSFSWFGCYYTRSLVFHIFNWTVRNSLFAIIELFFSFFKSTYSYLWCLIQFCKLQMIWT